jgi:UDPglucose--hexose-1-phosphate uridylyltransferase
MPELRQNLATREWVIIATERARRPNAFIELGHHVTTEARSPHDDACPFCIGNEELDLEVYRYPEEGAWQSRVVLNKFPALLNSGDPVRTFDGVIRRLAGVGHHEVVVEHPRHNTTMALIAEDDILTVLETLLHRGLHMSKDHRIEQIVFFKNHGERAGASLPHPHCQIIGLPMVPGDLRRRIEIAQYYFDDHGECAYCKMINDELERDARIIAVNEHFVAFVLYAALSPFHIWILPRRHYSSFLLSSGEELFAMAEIMRTVLRKLYFGLNDPDYNFIIRTAPVKEWANSYFHWYMTLVPRLSRTAGFELGSGMRINPTLPEDCARFLCDIDISK